MTQAGYAISGKNNMPKNFTHKTVPIEKIIIRSEDITLCYDTHNIPIGTDKVIRENGWKWDSKGCRSSGFRSTEDRSKYAVITSGDVTTSTNVMLLLTLPFDGPTNYAKAGRNIRNNMVIQPTFFNRDMECTLRKTSYIFDEIECVAK